MKLKSVLSIVQGWAKIKGNSDGTFIGNVGDKLKVTGGTGGIVADPVPGKKVRYFGKRFLNGSAENMAVDGSVTNQLFSVSVDTSETWYLKSVSIYVSEVGGLVHDKFANGPILTNGLQLESRINGIDSTQDILIKRNSGFATIFFDAVHVASSNNFSGKVDLDPEVTMTESTGDYVRWRIQDDATNAVYMVSTAVFWKVI